MIPNKVQGTLFVVLELKEKVLDVILARKKHTYFVASDDGDDLQVLFFISLSLVASQVRQEMLRVLGRVCSLALPGAA